MSATPSFPNARVGDVNPRSLYIHSGDCPAERSGFACTLDAGHGGQHLAEGELFVAAAWTEHGPVLCPDCEVPDSVSHQMTWHGEANLTQAEVDPIMHSPEAIEVLKAHGVDAYKGFIGTN